jgi:hypothetical protein
VVIRHPMLRRGLAHSQEALPHPTGLSLRPLYSSHIQKPRAAVLPAQAPARSDPRIEETV